jgi:small subunit ribosomal protein S21
LRPVRKIQKPVEATVLEESSKIRHFGDQSPFHYFMLIVEIKNGESIDQALKRFKRKFQQTQTLKELRTRREFTKPSITKRAEYLKAVYKEQKKRAEEI